MANALWDAKLLEVDDVSSDSAQVGYPSNTRVTGQLTDHVSALLRLFASDAPLVVPICPTDAHKLRYVIGDASAEGFGAGTQFPDMVFSGHDGLWCEVFALGGSNLREAQAQVNHLLQDVRQGLHNGCEIWACLVSCHE